MANNKKSENKEALKKTIDPKDIILEDDSDMPQPETKEYKTYLKCTNFFLKMVHNTVGTLPYNTILKNDAGDQIRLTDFMHFIEAKKDKMGIDEMNTLIGYIAHTEYNCVHSLMEIIDQKEKQGQLWTAFEA